MEDHILDLSKRHWETSRHGLTLIGTWVRLDGRWRPCMAIVFSKGITPKPCIIPLEDAWRWSDAIGEPGAIAGRMLEQLGAQVTPDNVFKLVSFVNSRMQELVTMPPRPVSAEEHAAAVAELTIVNDVIHGRIEVEL